MNKTDLVDQIRSRLEVELQAMTLAAKAAYDAATHEESKAEDEHDTRGIESSYLAGAQAQRVAEVQQLIHIYKNLEIRAFTATDPIGPTALVELGSQGRRSFYFIAPQGAGMKIQMGDRSVQVISPQSPLGEELIGRKVGDEVELDSQGNTREYQVVSVH